MKGLKKWCLLMLLWVVSFCSKAQTQTGLSQTIKGIVLDADSRKALSSASIELSGLKKIVLTDSSGNFYLSHVPVGRQIVSASLIGYESAVVSEILVTSGKEIFITVLLREKVKQLDEIKLVARKNRQKAVNEFAGASARGFSVEETKRYAAAAFDPARMAQNFAGVSNNGDGDNSIVVRGNSPKGVLWRLEGIEIPSPNHFGGLGGSGGSISMLSSSTLGQSDFYTGAFPAEFGNALSGAFDLTFRNGNKDKSEHSAMIGGLGVELSTEGPFKKGGMSSYLVNFRYSTLSLLKSFINLQGIAPDYQDLSFKLNFPTRHGTFALFGIGGLNKAIKDPEKDSLQWDDDNPNFVVNNKSRLGVVGLSHQVFLSSTSYLKTIISASHERYIQKGDTLSPSANYMPVPTFRGTLSDNAVRISVLYNNKLNSRHTVRAGIIASYLAFDYNNSFLDESDDTWKNVLNSDGNTMFYQAYAQWKYRINNKLSVQAGLHGSLFALNEAKSIEPRASVNYQLRNNQSITFSAGMHSKPEHLSTYYFEKSTSGLPASRPKNDLLLSRALHMVLAYNKSFAKGIRFKAESYYQHLYHIPVEKDANGFFSMLNASDLYSLFETDSALVSDGTGTNYGLDISLEKSFSRNYYFLVAGSVFNSTFKTYAGKTFNTKFNRNYQVNAVAGKEWKVGKGKTNIMAVNGKLLASGSLRDSPIDVESSKQEGKAVYEKDKYYTSKAGAYYRLDIGLSFKLNRKKMTHSFSLDIQNVTNHQNLFYSYYDNDKQRIRKEYQLGLFPIFNYRVEF